MKFNHYQDLARTYALPRIAFDKCYLSLGLCGEAGEVAEKFKKIIRDHNPGDVISEEYKESIALELGDVLWYLSNIAFCSGYTLDQIAQMNIKKLESRKEREVLGGSGDNR